MENIHHQSPEDSFETIDWSPDLLLEKDLLPIEDYLSEKLNLSEAQTHGASWALGLIASAAISSHESILYRLKDEWWETPMKKRGASAEMLEAGEKFFQEEAVHALTYRLFIAKAADELNLSVAEINSFLPNYRKDSALIWLYRLERKLGGHAVWWTVAVTEEESICLYRMLADKKTSTEPLFHHINRLHFLEEARHSSYSYQMLSMESPLKAKISYRISRILQSLWLFSQLKRLKNVEDFADRHPLLKEWSEVSKKIRGISFVENMGLIFKDVSYLSMMLNPQEHPRINRQIQRPVISEENIPKISFSEFKKNPYFFFKYFLTSLIAVIALLALTVAMKGGPQFNPEFSWWHLGLLPFAFAFGIQVPVMLHNVVHYNIKPKILNEILGELCGFFVLFGMAPFRVSHVLHHAHADTELDTHPPDGKSFFHFLTTTQMNSIKVIIGQYFLNHGKSAKTKSILVSEMLFYYLGIMARVATWYTLLGPTLFISFYVPAYLVNLVVFAHINFATHRTLPSGEVEIVNLNHNLYYKVVNFLGSGAYFHKNHHKRPNLYNPSKM